MGLMGDIGENAANAGVGMGLGIIGSAIGGNRQVKNQDKMAQQQLKYNKELAKYNQELGIDTWNRTNAEAQAKHYRDAGLSVGMMYGGSGAGGATTSTPTQSVSGGSASDQSGVIAGGAQMMLQAQNMQAQNDLIEAQTENVKANTAKTTGIDTLKAQQETDNISVQTVKQMLENEYMQGDGSNVNPNRKKSGYELRFDREVAENYAKKLENSIKEIQIEQMPKELQLKTQEVILKGQELAVDWKNAETNSERNAIYKQLETMKLELEKSMFDRNMTQRQIEFTVNKVMGVVETGIGIRTGNLNRKEAGRSEETRSTTTYGDGESETRTYRRKL